MSYTHTEKAGNCGDVVKHAILATIVDYLVSRSKSGPFIYVETHAGRPVYRLERKGEWQAGIGLLCSNLKSCRASVKEDLERYTTLCLAEPPQPGSEYPGSSGLVFQMLKSLGRPYRFILCDVDSAVIDALMGYFPQWNQVTVCRGDGFEMVRMIGKASLVLVDPAYMDTEADKRTALKTLKLIKKRKIPLICWTPRVEPPEDSKDEPVYPSYEREVAKEFGSISFKWPEPESKGFSGCHIVVSEELEEIAGTTADKIREVMGWSLK
jgi:23S rRNA A2030 N6-methylase RlmJ